MNEFVRTVKSQAFVLDASDMVTSFSNISFIFIYKNSDGASAEDFMPSSRLRSSFYRALQEFPILAGNVKVAKHGHTFIDVDQSDLNMPEYLEADSQVHFKDLEAARFNWSALPEGLCTVSSTPKRGSSGRIRLVHVNAVRLRDNSGLVLFISIGHFVVDGVGYCNFVNRWAEIAKWMASGAPESKLPVRQYLFDRSIVPESLPSQGKGLSEYAKGLYDSPTYFGRWLAWLSPETRGALLDRVAKMTRTSCHYFHISRKSLDSLRREVAGEMSSSQRISDNDIVSALLAYATAKAIQDYNNESAGRGFISSVISRASQMLFGRPSKKFLNMTAIDLRPRVQKLKSVNYTGNSSISMAVLHDISSLTRPVTEFKELAPICTDVRNAVDNATEKLIREVYDIQNKSASHFAFTIAQMMAIEQRILITNQSRFTFYENDFGQGIPECVYPMPWFPADVAAIQPVHPSSDGVNIFLAHKEHIMAKILSNELWTKYVELLF
ncbi:hypothetical protein GGF46_000671 [Coemansia sp. RSA 552]|nr:hypothetical protein GGF46_000671 [Coemansia sp. RSA 552]